MERHGRRGAAADEVMNKFLAGTATDGFGPGMAQFHGGPEQGDRLAERGGWLGLEQALEVGRDAVDLVDAESERHATGGTVGVDQERER